MTAPVKHTSGSLAVWRVRFNDFGGEVVIASTASFAEGAFIAEYAARHPGETPAKVKAIECLGVLYDERNRPEPKP